MTTMHAAALTIEEPSDADLRSLAAWRELCGRDLPLEERRERLRQGSENLPLTRRQRRV